ncbi:hypothetical protein [Cohnella lupini]|uniref:Uncharacterized protein n=1 Tax=Cohnella lupini TaxID=1294267 RepID=A0A3D9IPU9_9BACL|nr:hypothetical protein [Cohnella lupini]RED63791.1 hypothetical protein DFP95_10330 [Cohnella lupini]
MNRVAGIIRTHLTDRWSWLFLPWIVLLSSFVCNLIIATAGDEIYTGGLASIFIYMMVIGIVSVGQTFPFLIGFGARRKDYFLGTTATIGIIGIASSFILLLMGYIETRSEGWGLKLHFFDLPYISDGNVLARVWVLFNFMLHFFFLGFVISCIHRKFGRNGLYILFILSGIIITVSLYLINSYGSWDAIFDWFADISAAQLASGMFVVTLVYVILSYLMLRRATV